jgi:hypothetical protein
VAEAAVVAEIGTVAEAGPGVVVVVVVVAGTGQVRTVGLES